MGETSAASLLAKQFGWIGENSPASLIAKQLGWTEQIRKSLELLSSRPLLASERTSYFGTSAVESSAFGVAQHGLLAKQSEFAKSIAAMNADAGLLKAASRQAELFSQKLTITSTFSQRIRPLPWPTPPLVTDILPRHHVSAFLGSNSITEIKDLATRSLIGDSDKWRFFGVQPSLVQELSRLQAAASFPKSLQETFEKSRRLFAAVDRVVTAWEDNALWFILSCLNQGCIYLFDGLDRQQVEAALLDALETVVREGRYTKALGEVIAKAPYMTDYQRDILIHALGHAENGEFRFALSQLMDGLEGALLHAAIGLSVVDQDRWLIGKPKTRRNRTHNIERVIHEMSLDSEYQRFLHKRVFGKVGNPVRHGDVDDGERRQVLLGIVALAGWVDVFMSLKARPVLVQLMSDRLPTAVKQLPR